MSQQRINSALSQGSFSRIQQRAIWLARVNACMQRQLPLSINTTVKLANIDTRQRAVLHVRGGEWATTVRMQQGLIRAILKSCGIDGLKGVVVKNRPLKQLPEEELRPTRVKRDLSQQNRDLLASIAESATDEKLKQSLRRLARKRV